MDNYKPIVDHLESNLADYAMKSFDSETFIDGGEIFKYYNDLWAKEGENKKLINRTPIQHQRDKILYSNGIRKQSEKYHILYRDGKKIIRNYITHTMRMMQVTRTICRALKLNEDFAEALVLGSKLGALPFIHASKGKISEWAINKIKEIDFIEEKQYTNNKSKELALDDEYLPKYPQWIRQIQNQKILKQVESYIPFASGLDINNAYSSGKQGYWLLSTNPYTVESNTNSFAPELMFGIWRHSLNSPNGVDSFHHSQKISNAYSNYHNIDWSNISYESLVVRYADDITWVIENLNDSNNATLVNNPQNKGLFQELWDQGNFDNKLLMMGLSKRDSGKLYSYFINDFINHSTSILSKNEKELKLRLKSGEDSCLIGLSSEGEETLKFFKGFLDKRVFKENRVFHRKQMLETITEGCIDLIYQSKDDFLKNYIESKANIEGWSEDSKRLATELLNNDIHRIQVAINVFSELSDQEIFSFVGMDSF
ncbi:hypothetical protein [uncultured Psychroserpens sp.]|uniref:hypothetical protein n=1 Tax=uncultured Psychroserpens sp. TaxID=255436 RepID=UPI00260740A8|nr:hypothetical protein [uncultured Psychroserpens sp.]